MAFTGFRNQPVQPLRHLSAATACRERARLLPASPLAEEVCEHRAAPASPPVSLELIATNAEMTRLEVIAGQHDENGHRLQEQVLTRTKLRDTLAVKNERLGEALQSLEQAGRIRRTPAGWQPIE